MKKIRIELKPNATSKAFRIFDSSEALYLWLINKDKEYDDVLTHACKTVTINQGEFIEVEWYGCEIEWSTSPPLKLIFVRMAKNLQTKNGLGSIVTIHAGWIDTSEMNFENYEDDSIIIKRLLSMDDWKMDLRSLFMDDIESDIDQQDDEDYQEEP